MPEGTLTAVETPKGTPVTHASLLPMRFAAVKEFRGMSKEQCIAFAHERIESLRPVLVLAGEVLAQNKDELTAKVVANLDTWGPLLMHFAEAAKVAGALTEVLQSAEVRLVVAIAIAEGDDDGGDDGGGEAEREAA